MHGVSPRMTSLIQHCHPCPPYYPIPAPEQRIPTFRPSGSCRTHWNMSQSPQATGHSNLPFSSNPLSLNHLLPSPLASASLAGWGLKAPIAGGSLPHSPLVEPDLETAGGVRDLDLRPSRRARGDPSASSASSISEVSVACVGVGVDVGLGVGVVGVGMSREEEWSSGCDGPSVPGGR